MAKGGIQSVPKVSVALPVYNGGRYLRIAIEAILAQTFKDFELIIADNASTDETEIVCRDYAASDRRIKYHRNPTNIGAPKNFNLSFQLSSGTYLKWSTSDDYVGPEMIEKCAAYLDANPDVVLCYPKAKLIDAEGKFLENYDDVLDLHDSMPSQRFINLLTRIKLAHQHTGLIRTEALRRIAPLSTHIASDINLLAELSLYGKFYELPEYLLFRRYHPASSSWDRKSTKKQIEWSDPGRMRYRLDTWEAESAFASAVRRCPARLSEKLTMYNFLAKRCLWKRNELWEELKDAARLRWEKSISAKPD
jgi:glycosyltransferase involved in cell wall biosynthesis